jgi:hypothetical protein
MLSLGPYWHAFNQCSSPKLRQNLPNISDAKHKEIGYNFIFFHIYLFSKENKYFKLKITGSNFQVKEIWYSPRQSYSVSHRNLPKYFTESTPVKFSNRRRRNPFYPNISFLTLLASVLWSFSTHCLIKHTHGLFYALPKHVYFLLVAHTHKLNAVLLHCQDTCRCNALTHNVWSVYRAFKYWVRSICSWHWDWSVYSSLTHYVGYVCFSPPVYWTCFVSIVLSPWSLNLLLIEKTGQSILFFWVAKPYKR